MTTIIPFSQSMLMKNNSLNSSYSSNSTSSSVQNLAESIIQDVQKIEKVHILFDKATLLYERGEYRKAFLYFDICVTAKQDDAKYRLSRAICAFALNVFELTFQDAMISMKYKEVQERDTSTKEIKRVLSDKLLITLKADHRRHLARCKYWMARANSAQGDYEGALRDLDDSENYMESKKAQELMLICQERKKQGLSSLFYNTAPSRNRKLFCDEISIVDDYSNFTIYHLKTTSPYKEYKIPPHLTRSRLQHPTDAQLPITLLGTFAIFDREIYLQEKFQQIQKLIKIQQDDIQARKMQLYEQYRKEVQLLESSNGDLNKKNLAQEDDLMIRVERLNE